MMYPRIALLLLSSCAATDAPTATDAGVADGGATCSYALEACTPSAPSVRCCGARGYDYDPQRRCATRDQYVRACNSVPADQECGGTLDVVCYSRSDSDGKTLEVFVSTSGDGRPALASVGFVPCDATLSEDALTHSSQCQ